MSFGRNTNPLTSSRAISGYLSKSRYRLEWQWVKDAQAAAPDISGKDLLRERFASMR